MCEVKTFEQFYEKLTAHEIWFDQIKMRFYRILMNGEQSPVYQLEHRFKETYRLNDITIDARIIGDRFQGIELTEEWLNNFGFDIEWTIGGYLKWEKQMPYEEKFKLLDRRLPHPQYHEPKATIQYVHQLQNLFFALTGTELELKK